MEYLAVKWLHIVSSTLLFGTGIGSAFYLLLTSLTRDMRAMATVTRLVVWADWLFTTPTVILQPFTGFYLLHLSGMPLHSHWVVHSLILYVIAIGCWIPVVWIQMKMRDCVGEAVKSATALPAIYKRYLIAWALLGIPALVAFLLIFYLMVFKPL
jgi:uncharacterized membrane protein